MEIPQIENKKRLGFFRFIKWCGISLLSLAVAGFAFVKLDTSLAAQTADQYLRPLIGGPTVIFMEKVFFDFSDKVSAVIYKFKKPDAPQFDSSNVQPITAADLQARTTIPTSLDLSPISVNSAFQPLNGEGVWHNIPLNIFPDKEVAAYTFIRPDPDRSYAIASLVKMDTSVLSLGSVAGTAQPGGPVGKPGPGKVPSNIQKSGNLVAAFDGGFQYSDGAYGMIVGNTTYLPLKNGLGTVVGYQDGTVQIINYNGQQLGSNLAFVRQNGPLLISNGSIVVDNPNSTVTWGRVVGTDAYTWRSGIGITESGDLVFAAGNNLNPLTLASALKDSGAIDAIQLDINPYWVRFNVFNSTESGTYNSFPLNNEMQDGAKSYLNGYQKDFFYVYKR